MILIYAKKIAQP